jgi:hypothetical protein
VVKRYSLFIQSRKVPRYAHNFCPRNAPMCPKCSLQMVSNSQRQPGHSRSTKNPLLPRRLNFLHSRQRRHTLRMHQRGRSFNISSPSTAVRSSLLLTLPAISLHALIILIRLHILLQILSGVYALRLGCLWYEVIRVRGMLVLCLLLVAQETECPVGEVEAAEDDYGCEDLWGRDW